MSKFSIGTPEDASSSIPATPTNEPTNEPNTDSRPTLSRTPSFTFRGIASYENLVLLANQQERLREVFSDPQRSLSEARKIVWRDKGQPVVVLNTLEECLRHAGKGGLHAAVLAFSFRSALSVVLALLRIRKLNKKQWLGLISRAIFSEESFRFAAMLGTFASLYKLILNSLPLYSTPPDIPPPTPAILKNDSLAAVSLTSTAKETLSVVRKRTRLWHASLAGTIAGALAILWEPAERRSAVGQQMFVRGLQGSWNTWSSKRGIVVPYGDVLVFSLACGQIMYAFVLRKDTISRVYNSWIGKMARAPARAVRMNADLVRSNGARYDIADLKAVLNLKELGEQNRTALLPIVASPHSWDYPFVPCAAIHPTVSSCMHIPLDRFIGGFWMMLPVYGALHLIPAIVFNWSRFLRNPAKVGGRAIGGTIRSSTFLGVFIVIYQTVFCYKHYLFRTLPRNKLTQYILPLLVSRFSFWLPGFLSGLSLFVEAKRRRGELAMYVLPKGLESLWVMLRGRGLVWGLRKGRGEVLLTAAGMGMVMSTYQNDPQHLSSIVRRIMYQFIGPN